MPESIYYRNSANAQKALLDTISSLVFRGGGSAMDSETTAHIIPAWNSAGHTPLVAAESAGEERDIGAFFTDERMSKHRGAAIACAAGLAVVRRTIGMRDLESVGLKPFSSRYALGFLSCNTTAEFSAMSPAPADVFLARTTTGRNNTAQYETLPALDLLAEDAEERYPLLHAAIEQFS